MIKLFKVLWWIIKAIIVLIIAFTILETVGLMPIIWGMGAAAVFYAILEEAGKYR